MSNTIDTKNSTNNNQEAQNAGAGSGLEQVASSIEGVELLAFKTEVETNLEAISGYESPINWYESPISKMSLYKEAVDFELSSTINKFNAFFTRVLTQELNEITTGLMKNFELSNEKEIGVKLYGLEAKELAEIDNIVIYGSGQSYSAASYGSYMFKKLGIFNTVMAENASEYEKEGLPQKKPGMILLSAANEAEDALEAYKSMRKLEPIVKAISIIDVPSLNKGVVFNNNLLLDNDLTKKISRCYKQVIYMGVLGLWFSDIKKNGDELAKKKFMMDLLSLPEKSYSIVKHSFEQAEKISLDLLDQEHLFVLGKGPGFPVAVQAALLFKRISKIHAEGYCSGAFKHGPIALINPAIHTPFVLLIFDDENFDFMTSTLNQIKSRGAYVVVVTDCKEKIEVAKTNAIIEVPECGVFSALLALLALEIVAFEYALISKLRNRSQLRAGIKH